MSGQPAVLQVVILRDGLLVGTEVFVPGQYTLGSAPGADLRLDDASVSPAHASLYFQNGKAAVQDLQSTIGLYVNGHRVTACEVRPVDEIVVGPFSLKVRVLAQKPAANKSGPPPELAALFGNPQPPPPAPPQPAPAAPVAQQRPGQVVPSTVVSARRLSAVPQQAPPAKVDPVTAPVVRPAHLRPVEQQREEARTESVIVGELAEVTAPGVVAPPAPAKPVQRAAPVPATHAKAVTAPAPLAPAKVQSGKAPAHQAPPPPARAAPAKAQPPPAQRPAAARKRSLPSIPAATDGKGRPTLFFELYWGETRRHAHAVKSIKANQKLFGAQDDKSPVPLWGFNVPPGGAPFPLASQKGSAFRIFIPPGAAVEQRATDGNFYPVSLEQLDQVGQLKSVLLNNGNAIRLSGESEISLVAYVQPAIPRPFSNPLAGLPWLVMFLLAIFGGGFGAFIAFAPSMDSPDFTGKTVQPVAVRLLAPEPKKKEEAKKKLEEIKKKEPAKKKEEVVAARPEPVQKKAPPPPATPPETQKALKSLEKLSAAGPAMKDLLAAVDKLGNGPGKKDAKSDYKLTGLLGKQPIANAGLGTFGLGGGGQGGMGTKGLEVLRGKGGGGIGALGAGNVGKGSVGGTVARASTRSIGVTGTIDKEAVAKVINSHLAEVSSCYERALLKEPGLQGKIVLEWNISTTGTVTTAKTKTSSMRSAAVESCILASLKTWKFPPAKGAGVVISYPFLFNSVGY